MKTKILASFVACWLLSQVSSAVQAAEHRAVRQVTALDNAAVAGYAAGDFNKMKRNLFKAVAVGKNALAAAPVMAKVYVHLGVLFVDGLDNRAVGIRYFVKAIKIRPDIAISPNMATKTVMSAFKEVGHQEEAPDTEEAAAPPIAKSSPPSQRRDDSDDEEDADDKADPAPRRPARATAGSERCASNAELADVKKQAREEFDRLEKALVMSKDALTKERAESEKFRKDSMNFERQLGEAKQRVTQLENEGSQKDKRSSAVAQREKKEREAKEAIAKEKAETDSLVLDTAQRVQQLETETAEKDKQIAAKDKQLAAALEREKKEREAREKVERERQTAEVSDRERKDMEQRARAERDKIEAGPPLPSRIPEPLHCAVPEEVQGGADLAVQCVTQPAIKAKTIVFYYRPPDGTLYNALVMDPTRRGWSRAVITANKLNGKLLHYYAEARDGRETVAATNGRASSPNVVTIAAPNRR